MSSTIADHQSMTSSSVGKTAVRPQLNLFQKLDILSNELQLVGSKLDELSQQTASIMQQKRQVQRYLQSKSQQNRLRLMGQIQSFQNQIKKKIDHARLETQKVDHQINMLKEVQLNTLQNILALQRRVQELEVQLGTQPDYQ